MHKARRSLGKRVIALILLITVVDQLVKIAVKTTFDPHERLTVIDGFFQLYYIENRGMAFGTTLGSGAVAKYALSIFRLVAIVSIGYYIRQLLKEPTVQKGMIYSVGLIFAGATGNLIDGMVYDCIWPVRTDIAWNWALDGTNNWLMDEAGQPVIRPHGFLLGSVVDMFQFTAKWPSWMPFGWDGAPIFGFIWNVSDAAITIGVLWVVTRYRAIFKRRTKAKTATINTASATDRAVEQHPSD